MACDRSRLQILAFCCSPFLHRMSKLRISKHFLPRIPTRYDLTVSYSVSSQQLGSINMLSSCVSGVFLNTTISCQKLGTDILTITWAYSTQPGLSALSRSEFKTVLSWLLSHHLILQRSLPQSTRGQVKLSAVLPVCCPAGHLQSRYTGFSTHTVWAFLTLFSCETLVTAKSEAQPGQFHWHGLGQ